MKREKKLKYIFKVCGFVIGGILGSFLGYQMAQFSKAGAYEDVSTLSFFLSLLLGSLGCVFGFALTSSLAKDSLHC